MHEPDPFAFDPVPLRARRDGWTPERQRRFVDLLIAGCGPSEAAQAVGKTKQTAFALRDRPGAGSFRAAWDAAVAFASDRRDDASRRSAGPRAGEAVLVPRFYRGRLVAVERRATSGGMMRLLAQLDRWASKASDPALERIAFDDLLDLIAPKLEQPKRRRRSPADREQLGSRFAGRRDGYGS